MNGYDFWRDEEALWDVKGTYSNYIFRGFVKLYLYRVLTVYFINVDEMLGYINNYNPTKPLFTYLSWQTVHAPIENPPNAHASTCSTITNSIRKAYCEKMVVVDKSLELIG